MTTTEEPGFAPVVGGVPTDLAGPDIAEPPEPELLRDDRYLRLLLILLVSAAFFEGYDSSILALLLPNIQSTFGVSEATLGLTRIPIELGLFVAFFVARLSDRLGRRPMLLWSVVGYTVVHRARRRSAGTSGRFAFFQFASRVFLGAEYAIGVTMIVEEFPAAPTGPGPRHAAHVRRARAPSSSASCSASACRTRRSTGGPSTSSGCSRCCSSAVPPPPPGDPPVPGGAGRAGARPSPASRCSCRGERSTGATSCSSASSTCSARSRCSGRRRGGPSTPSGSGASPSTRSPSTSSAPTASGASATTCAAGSMERFGRRPHGHRLRRSAASRSRSSSSRPPRRPLSFVSLLLARVLRARHGAGDERVRHRAVPDRDPGPGGGVDPQRVRDRRLRVRPGRRRHPRRPPVRRHRQHRRHRHRAHAPAAADAVAGLALPARDEGPRARGDQRRDASPSRRRRRRRCVRRRSASACSAWRSSSCCSARSSPPSAAAPIGPRAWPSAGSPTSATPAATACRTAPAARPRRSGRWRWPTTSCPTATPTGASAFVDLEVGKATTERRCHPRAVPPAPAHRRQRRATRSTAPSCWRRTTTATAGASSPSSRRWRASTSRARAGVPPRRPRSGCSSARSACRWSSASAAPSPSGRPGAARSGRRLRATPS